MMQELLREHSVSAVCSAFGLSRSGQYARAKARPSARREQDERIKATVLRVHRDGFGVYGYPRIRLALRREGFRHSRRRVARLMAELGIRGVCRGKSRPCGTDSRHGYGYAPNLLGKLDRVESAHQVWVSDTTYIRTGEGWAYLAVTMDLATRYVAGWSVSVRNDSELTAEAAGKALARFRSARPMHHSDRGSTYSSWEFQQAIGGLERSMSRKGNCYDNAAMESFFGTLKAESGCCGSHAGVPELEQALFAYIESFYNTRRIHTSLGKPPLEALKDHGPSSPSCSQGACGDSSPSESSAPHEQLGLDSATDISNN
jgi:transposase InsO family protein